MANNNRQQVPTRLTVPAEHSAMQPIVSDLYDKLAALQAALQGNQGGAKPQS